MRALTMIVALVLAPSAPAAAQSGLAGALERQDSQRALQQSEQRREIDVQRHDLQRQLDRGRLQQLIDRQQTLRQAPIPCPFDRPPAGC
ncbi:MAG: hypothetical protein HY359_15670 [Candidatus Rokubacteria bacterium]|nr:hypothetical protein [Candidatus Rokubacteria bacterium]